jgi:hypothetical protein
VKIAMYNQPEEFLQATENKRMLHLQNIAPLDKLPKTLTIYIRSAPLHWHLFLAIWHLCSAALKKVYWEESQKNGILLLDGEIPWGS